jgi:uncharacterized protein
MVNSINLMGGKYIYLCDFNLIVNQEIKNRFLKSNQPEKIIIQEVDISDERLQQEFKKLRQIQFETTQSCNLRCKYCIYSPYYYYRRNYSKDTLNFQTARKSLDYIYNIIKDRYEKHIAISFYGGEPLLNFKTIKEIVEYVKEKFIDWEIDFHITTNGTLLSDQIIDFFYKYCFYILISLDGPKEIHDSKRIFPNGKGSFELVLKSLKKILLKNESYYKKNVSFSAVWSYDLSIKKIYDFFSRNELTNKNKIWINPVISLHNDYFIKYPFNKEKTREEFKDVISLIGDRIKSNKNLMPVESYLSFNRISQMLSYKNFTALFGTCFFNSRLYVTTKGEFLICHQIGEKFSIGNIWKGLDLNKMKKILNDFIDINKKYCYKCDVRYLCQRCFVTLSKNNKFEANDDICKNRRMTILNNLEEYVRLKEEQL